MPQWWPAAAKLNLYLHVVGRRADGYHLLDSLVAFADIGDRIAVRPAEKLSLSITGPFASDLANDDESNLVWRAAQTLARHLGRAPAAALTLEKNLPVASGIGGGSADAAASLKALAQLWHADIGDDALRAIAATLGADVPVCLATRASWFAGIGDIVESAPPLPPVPLVLVNPRVALPTATVFKARTGPFSAPARFKETPATAEALAALLATRRNDLTEAAIAQLPVIATILARLEAAQDVLLARMSGSGATCFALFRSKAAAEAAAAAIAAEARGWWVASGALF